MDTLRDFLYKYKKLIIAAVVILTSLYAIGEVLGYITWYTAVLGVTSISMIPVYFIVDIILDLLILVFAAVGLIICVNFFAKEKLN